MSVTLATGCAAELARAEEELATLTPAVRSAAQATRRAALLYRRAGLTGRTSAYRDADGWIDLALQTIERWPDLWLLKATLDLHFHRFDAARRHVAAAPGLKASPEGRALIADVDLHLGDAPAARRAYEVLVERDPCCDHLARLAELEAAAGRHHVAEGLRARAEDDLTAKQMRSFAWLQLQRGRHAAARGRFDSAAALYDRADAAYSGYWLVTAHRAKLAMAEGNVRDAIPLYEELSARVSRPEFEHQLGDAYLRAGDVERARTCHARALAGYSASIERGEVHELHRLALFHLEVRRDAQGALAWAMADLKLRRSALALSTAARCLDAAGQLQEGRRLAEEAAAINPFAAPVSSS